jgi:hypothetical protein
MCYTLNSETHSRWRQVAQGMLWVWGDSGPAAHIHAAAKPAQTAPWMDMQARPARARAQAPQLAHVWCRSWQMSLHAAAHAWRAAGRALIALRSVVGRGFPAWCS